MSLYLDTSCFLKVFFPEPETQATIALIGAEPEVVVSSLGRLVQIQARVAAREQNATAVWLMARFQDAAARTRRTVRQLVRIILRRALYALERTTPRKPGLGLPGTSFDLAL